MTDEELVKIAIEAKKNSYAPYSNFHVGAALLGKNGKVYKGCNIENAAFGPTNCGERTAIFNAVSDGCREFEKLAIVTDSENYEYPCGVCRQVMSEFCDDLKLILANNEGKYIIDSLVNVLPHMFKLEKNKKEEQASNQDNEEFDL